MHKLIPGALWDDLVTYFAGSDGGSDLDDEELADLYMSIRGQIKDKLDAEARRQAYSAYKTAPDQATREAQRQAYLDLSGVPEDYRWSAEQDMRAADGEDVPPLPLLII